MSRKIISPFTNKHLVKSTLRSAITLTLTLLLFGCATGPTYNQMANIIKPAAPDYGRIYIYRKSIAGSRIQPDITLNGEVVGKAKPRGFFFLDLLPGDYEITTQTQADGNVQVNLNAMDEVYVRLEMNMGFTTGRVKPVLVDAEEGEQDLTLTKYAGDQNN